MNQRKTKQLRKRFKRIAQQANLKYKFVGGLGVFPARNQYQQAWRMFKRMENG